MGGSGFVLALQAWGSLKVPLGPWGRAGSSEMGGFCWCRVALQGKVQWNSVMGSLFLLVFSLLLILVLLILWLLHILCGYFVRLCGNPSQCGSITFSCPEVEAALHNQNYLLLCRLITLLGGWD